MTAIDEDGSYRLAGMPGPGLVAVRLRGRLPQGQRTGRRVRDQGGLRPDESPLPTMNYTAIARIDPATGCGIGEAGRDARPGLDLHGHGARAGRHGPWPGRGASA